MKSVALIALSLGLLGGCTFNDMPAPLPTDPNASLLQPTTQPSYWLDQPPAATVAGDDFEKLWVASRHTANDYLFRIDREDFRGGVMTTDPLTSKQWFEIWRRDVPNLDDLAESSISTLRRTIRFEFTKRDGGYQVAPYVLIERFATSERRVTAVTSYRASLMREPKNPFHGTHETDRGFYLPPRYWYVIGRDETLEKNLADSIQKRLRG